MFHIALFEPCIPPNTGNIIRLAANNGCCLHLIEPIGFSMDEKKMRRAGLDHHEFVDITIHSDYWAFKSAMGHARIWGCTTKGTVRYSDVSYQAGDVLLFGSETHGLSDAVMADISISQRVTIPMKPQSRSLNLSNAVAIISYEALRQLNFSSC